MNTTLRKLLLALVLFGLGFMAFNLATFTFLFGTLTDGKRFLALTPGSWCVYLPVAEAQRKRGDSNFSHCGEFHHRENQRSATFIPVQSFSVTLPGWIEIENYDPSLWYQVRHRWLPVILLGLVMPGCGLAGLLVLISAARQKKTGTPPTAHNSM